MLLELIKYAGSGPIQFLTTLAILLIPCITLVNVVKIRITIYKIWKKGTNPNKNEEGDKS